MKQYSKRNESVASGTKLIIKREWAAAMGKITLAIATQEVNLLVCV
jgi:hypothetical protein